MKVLLCSDNPMWMSGYGKITLLIARHLISQGHEVIILGSDQRQAQFAPIDYEGCKLYLVQEYGTAEHIRWLLKNEKPDVVLANADPHFYAYLFKMDNEIRRTCPLVFYHLWDDSPFPKYNVPYYASCDRIIAGSRFTFNLLKESGEVDVSTIDYAPIGFDPQIYYPQTAEERMKFRTDFNASTNGKYAHVKFVAGFIGRNAPRKQLLSIMGSFCQWQKDKPDALLFVHAPVNDYAGQFEYVMKTLYHGANVVFSQADPMQQGNDLINRFYNFFDVLLNRSEAEGFGMPIAEAMLAGTPAITVDTTGPAGLVNAENGWLLPADILALEGSPVTPYIYSRFVTDEKFIAAIDEAYNNPTLRTQKASKCREYIMKNYSVRQLGENVENSLLTARKEWTPYPEYTVLTYPVINLEVPKEVVTNG